MRLAPLAAALSFVLCAVFAPHARAAGLYSVGGVNVDVTAASAAEARGAGIAKAQQIAFERLVARLTLPDQLAAVGAPPLAGPALDALAVNFDIERERPLGARYIARLRVNFDAAGVRAALTRQGLTVIESRGPPLLIVAQMSAGAPALADQWRAAWVEGAFGDELVPLEIAPAGLTGPPGWAAAAPFAAMARASGAVYATARFVGAGAYADIVQVGPDGGERALGAVTAPLKAGEEGEALRALADQVNARLQGEWKRSLDVPVAGAPRQRMAASAFYANQAEWRRVQSALQAAAKTIVSAVSIDAVSRTGAMVSFGFVGGRERLAAELLRNGLVLEDTPGGAVLKLAPGGA